MSDHELRMIAAELRGIRRALERLAPPPEPDQPQNPEDRKRRAVVVL